MPLHNAPAPRCLLSDMHGLLLPRACYLGERLWIFYDYRQEPRPHKETVPKTHFQNRHGESKRRLIARAFPNFEGKHLADNVDCFAP